MSQCEVRFNITNIIAWLLCLYVASRTVHEIAYARNADARLSSDLSNRLGMPQVCLRTSREDGGVRSNRTDNLSSFAIGDWAAGLGTTS
jgi:hypothetical protein